MAVHKRQAAANPNPSLIHTQRCLIAFVKAIWLQSTTKNNIRRSYVMVKDEGSMTSNSKISLNDAIVAMERAYARLSAATDATAAERAHVAANREALQAELTAGWQAHTASLETTLTQAQSENEFLKADNLRLSNQLQQLQQDYLELQNTAGDIVGRLDQSVRQLDLILEH
jgi:chromosome segregation ATPase